MAFIPMMQVAGAAEKIAGDNPLLWALVVAVGGLVTAIGILWKAYRDEARQKDQMTEKAITAMVTLTTQNTERQRQLDRIEQSLTRPQS